jgi:Spy/CpxP family protein refolding chaperone
VLVSLLACGAMAVAQGGGARQGRGGFGGGGGGNEFGLLRRSDVQADLQLSTEQKTKLDSLRESMRGSRGDGGQRGQGGQGGEQRTPPTDAEREARRADMESRRAEMQKQLASVLKPDQITRLREISVQLRGNMALLDDKVQGELGLSSAQVAKVKDLREKMSEAMRSVFEKAQGGEITREQAMESARKNNDVLKVELGKVLDANQAAKLKALGGSPFKADPAEEQRGFGFGGGGRRGGQRGGGGGQPPRGKTLSFV